MTTKKEREHGVTRTRGKPVQTLDESVPPGPPPTPPKPPEPIEP